MEPQNQPGATPAPTPTPNPAQPAVPAPQPAASPATPAAGEEWKSMTTEQFTARLAKEREQGTRALLKEFGFEKADDAKAFFSTAKAKADAEKTELQKATERATALEAQAKRAEELGAVVSTFAEQEFKALHEALQKFIVVQAGDDPMARLRAITAARESGLLAAQQPAPAATPEPRPANPATTVAQPGPATPKPVGTLTPYEQWQALKEANRGALAATFFVQNRAAIEASRPQ